MFKKIKRHLKGFTEKSLKRKKLKEFDLKLLKDKKKLIKDQVKEVKVKKILWK